MHRVENVIEVAAPLRAVYGQWTRFEDFPRFMSAIVDVRQFDDTHVRWEAEVLGHAKTWEAEITEQVPDERISWKSSAGCFNAGTLRFEAIGAHRTRVRLTMAFELEGWLLAMFEVTGLISSQIVAAMVQFKEFVESRGRSTDAWHHVQDMHVLRY